MAEEFFPFDSGPGADSTEARWRRMARVFAQSGVVGGIGDDAYAAAISGLTLTIKRRAATGIAEAWVDGHMHRLITSDWSVDVPANTATTARIDRIVLRLDSVANTVNLARVQGTPAASPVAPALTQVDNGVWEIGLWSFTVPANSGAPLAGLIDERYWIGPDAATGGSSGRIVAHGSTTTSTNSTTSETRVAGGLNVAPSLIPGRIYEIELSCSLSVNSGFTGYLTLRGNAGTSTPTTSSTLIGAASANAVGGTQVFGMIVTGKFTVGTVGVYSISPFFFNSGATAPNANFARVQGSTHTIVVRDAGPSVGVPGTTPLLVP